MFGADIMRAGKSTCTVCSHLEQNHVLQKEIIAIGRFELQTDSKNQNMEHFPFKGM